eukprot:CAMPEP_0203806262 /NCGR_PEP_ID=MMETSP0115-20131106/282_1 /ASSEMBLY_ACC=CAM_ASM_000227 /TAXON_ID=33651 /ORGANISM="Bicosoecid sp, Strain ms1" /LENGTH=80 /DNA_ID=CAMNT_0050714917 /DNA_START=8 /DNA_END=250 /DNA_ORIENTATION=+
MSRRRRAGSDEGMIQSYVLAPLTDFAYDSVDLVRKCQKPRWVELKRTALYTGAGMALLGFVGFFVKLIHIPINANFFGTS